jgi:hypothetical protein
VVLEASEGVEYPSEAVEQRRLRPQRRPPRQQWVVVADGGACLKEGRSLLDRQQRPVTQDVGRAQVEQQRGATCHPLLLDEQQPRLGPLTDDLEHRSRQQGLLEASAVLRPERAPHTRRQIGQRQHRHAAVTHEQRRGGPVAAPQRAGLAGVPTVAEHQSSPSTGRRAFVLLAGCEPRRPPTLDAQPPGRARARRRLDQKTRLPVAPATRDPEGGSRQVGRADVQELATAALRLEEAIHFRVYDPLLDVLRLAEPQQVAGQRPPGGPTSAHPLEQLLGAQRLAAIVPRQEHADLPWLEALDQRRQRSRLSATVEVGRDDLEAEAVEQLAGGAREEVRERCFTAVEVRREAPVDHAPVELRRVAEERTDVGRGAVRRP